MVLSNRCIYPAMSASPRGGLIFYELMYSRFNRFQDEADQVG